VKREPARREAGRHLEHLADLTGGDGALEEIVDQAVPGEEDVLEVGRAHQAERAVDGGERGDQELAGPGLQGRVAEPVPVPDIAGEMGGRADPRAVVGHGPSIIRGAEKKACPRYLNIVSV
jgi:hypothetical protein